jgi:predicted nucleotidyltransferase
MANKKTYANINIGPLSPIMDFKIVAVVINWIFQGLLYADTSEKIFKISVDLILTAIFFGALAFAFPAGSIPVYLATSLLVAHTVNWTLNGQIFALLKTFNVVHNDVQIILDYADGIKRRAAVEDSIKTVLIYGSLSREEMTPESDLDVRIVRMPGVVYGVKACIFGLRERARALVAKFPLDIYVVDSEKHLRKMRADEIPEVLYSRGSQVRTRG